MNRLAHHPRLLSQTALGIAAVLALMGTTTSADAALVTRSIGVTLSAAALSQTYNLDLDQNGATDFVFGASFAPDPFFPLGFTTIDTPFASSNAFVVDGPAGGFPNVTRLAAGSTVSMANMFSSLGDQGNLLSNFAGAISGNFNGTSGYLGLRFAGVGGGTFYGFALVNVVGSAAANNAFDLTITSVGYNDVAGAAIAIPAVGVVPEPGSLALVAAAGLGLLLSRRRGSASHR